MRTPAHPRLNIYVDDPKLREHVRVAAARRGVSLSAYCLESIRRRLAEDGYPPTTDAPGDPRAAAQALDRLRREVGPIGIPVSELIAEGRR
jgi:hypothetical protein